jgi:hypothetical protein
MVYESAGRGLLIPSLCILLLRVVLGSPRRAAAPPAPPMTQFDSRKTRRMWSGSNGFEGASSIVFRHFSVLLQFSQRFLEDCAT